MEMKLIDIVFEDVLEEVIEGDMIQKELVMKIEIEEKKSITEEEKSILRETLVKIPIGDLSKILGKQITKSLSEGGVSINALNLAENIIEIKAEQIFEEEIVRSYFNFYNTETIKTWTISKTCLKFLNQIGLSETFCPRKLTREFMEEVNTSFKLHDYQDFIKRKTSNFLLTKNKSKLMIQMPTGAGKQH